MGFQENIWGEVKDLTPEILKKMLASHKVKEICDKVAALKAQGKKDEANEVKKQLPGLIVSGTSTTGRRKDECIKLNGLYMADFDGISDARKVWQDVVEAHGGQEALVKQYKLKAGFITPSNLGIKLIAECDLDLNLFENQTDLATALGLEDYLDKGCKDASRLSYMVDHERILFIEDDLCTFCNEEYEAKWGEWYRNGKKEGVVATPAVSTPTDSSPVADTPIDYRGIKYETIIATWWAQNGGEPQVGDRNSKLFQLACNLRYICDFNADMLLKVMPDFGLPQSEMRALIASALKEKRYASFPKRLQKVLEELRSDEADDDENDEDDLMMNLNRQTQDKIDSMKWSPFWSAVMKFTTPDNSMGAILAVLPMLYTLATRVTYRYLLGKVHRLCGMTILIGPPASGKSFILDLDDAVMGNLRIADEAMREMENDFKRTKKKAVNTKEQPDEVHPAVRIVPMQISNSQLTGRMHDCMDSDQETQLHLYSCESELATVIRANSGGNWIEKTDIYCKGFSGERWGNDYKNADAVNGERPVLYNWVVSGTPLALSEFIPDGQVMDGLATRLMFYQMPDNSYSLLGLDAIERSKEEEDALKKVVEWLDTVEGMYPCREILIEVHKWESEVVAYAQREEDKELDLLQRRVGVMAMRAGVIFALIENFEKHGDNFDQPEITENCLRFTRMVADYCLQAQYIKYAGIIRTQQKLIREKAIMACTTNPMQTKNALDKLAETFTTDDVMQLLNLDRPTAKGRINYWKTKKLIEIQERGVYVKT